MSNKNNLMSLNDHLFAQMERLSDLGEIDTKEGINSEALEKEIERTNAMVKVGKTIIENASLMLDAHKHTIEYAGKKNELPEVYQQKDEKTISYKK